jgi:hypothetical protein
MDMRYAAYAYRSREDYAARQEVTGTVDISESRFRFYDHVSYKENAGLGDFDW